ncbi:hypothetical protein GCM10018966_020810 [Streptomyces yanii]
MPYDRGIEGVDDRGQGGLPVRSLTEGADDGERGAADVPSATFRGRTDSARECPCRAGTTGVSSAQRERGAPAPPANSAAMEPSRPASRVVRFWYRSSSATGTAPTPPGAHRQADHFPLVGHILDHPCRQPRKHGLHKGGDVGVSQVDGVVGVDTLTAPALSG